MVRVDRVHQIERHGPCHLLRSHRLLPHRLAGGDGFFQLRDPVVLLQRSFRDLLGGLDLPIKRRQQLVLFLLQRCQGIPLTGRGGLTASLHRHAVQRQHGAADVRCLGGDIAISGEAHAAVLRVRPHPCRRVSGGPQQRAAVAPQLPQAVWRPSSRAVGELTQLSASNAGRVS